MKSLENRGHMPLTSSPAELLQDSAIYRRTALGQRELLNAGDDHASPTMHLLARVNGCTDLRRLIDLAPEQASSMAGAILELVKRKLIDRVHVPELR
jgi:hypothetical protein